MVLIVSLITISCSDHNDSEEGSNEDYIDIISVEPAVGTEGEAVSFIITCDVGLISQTSGSIFIGFNNTSENPDQYIVKQVYYWLIDMKAVLRLILPIMIFLSIQFYMKNHKISIFMLTYRYSFKIAMKRGHHCQLILGR